MKVGPLEVLVEKDQADQAPTTARSRIITVNSTMANSNNSSNSNNNNKRNNSLT